MNLALVLIVVLFACRLSCLAAFAWQSASSSAHDCCQKPTKGDPKPENDCKALVYDSSLASAAVALHPSAHQVATFDPVEIGANLEAAYQAPIHSPPDLLALHHILLI